jgi:crotonobetainyl-CoA:carnitine CoA-transferase CaiB-like acyl-CoA transferase
VARIAVTRRRSNTKGDHVEQVLEGVTVVEVSAWAFVPSAGAVLADWGAEVIKVEPPTGDPMRGLINAGIGGGAGPSFPWEIWNRGKRSIALDLTKPDARDIVLRLASNADVFLTSYLPPTRRKLGLDIDDVRAVNPSIVYACGTGQGALGNEAEKGGYDSISFWARGGIASVVTPPDADRPIAQPGGAFGDSLSGMALAGGVAAALVRRNRSGEGAVVDVALLGTAMWSMQMSIAGASVMAAAGAAPSASAGVTLFNPLVNSYRTSDNRWVALFMLQRDRFWRGVCVALGRDDLLSDQRFADAQALGSHVAEAVAELEQTIASKTLAETAAALATQPGQWDVVRTVLELPNDPQAVANGFVQSVSYESGVELPLVASPAQFDRTPPALEAAPEFGADTERVLIELGMDMDEIIERKISGAVV